MRLEQVDRLLSNTELLSGQLRRIGGFEVSRTS
jgi:hypothetical protein